MGYLCANFSLPRPLCSRVRPDVYATDRRQIDRRQTSDKKHRLMPPPNGGGGIIRTTDNLESFTISSVYFLCEMFQFANLQNRRSVFIAGQHAVHAERDIVLPILSVRPSVQCRCCVETNAHVLILGESS